MQSDYWACLGTHAVSVYWCCNTRYRLRCWSPSPQLEGCLNTRPSISALAVDSSLMASDLNGLLRDMSLRTYLDPKPFLFLFCCCLLLLCFGFVAAMKEQLLLSGKPGLSLGPPKARASWLQTKIAAERLEAKNPLLLQVTFASISSQCWKLWSSIALVPAPKETNF